MPWTQQPRIDRPPRTTGGSGAETVARFRVRIHAHVGIANHDHPIVQTPEANLSRAIQWLNVSYVAWFNRRHDRVGPLMQGRRVYVADAPTLK